MRSRRDFIKKTALIAAGMASAPALLRAGAPPPVLGHNHKRYKLNRAWGKQDFSRYPVNDCHEMVLDKKGRIFLLTNETRNNILIYDRSGKILDSWGHEFPSAHGLSIADENGTEFLFICDTERRQVFKTTLDGRLLLTLDYPKEAGIYAKKEDFTPTETAIAPNGDIYIADGYGKDYILQFNAKGEFIRYFGGKGSAAQHLNNAHGICVDHRSPAGPTLIVSSRQQHCFKRYSMEGVFLGEIPVPGAWVCRPVIRGEYLYAAVLQSHSNAWQQSGFVTILDKNDRVVSNVGGSTPAYHEGRAQEMYQTVRAFQYPHDVCVDADENLYVCQWNSGKVYPYQLSPV